MKKIYIIGIGGAGTSALAVVYAKQGYDVSGVDVGDGFYHGVLNDHGIIVFDKYDTAHITDDIELVVHTAAVQRDNVEILAAQKRNIPVKTYAEAISVLSQSMRTIAVCGTHGKTTTTALTTYALSGADVKLTAIVGSPISAWHGGAYVSGSDIFVVEADEYLNKLALYQPYDVILTSVDYDHPDFFENVEAYHAVFCDFVARVPQDGLLIACGDDVHVQTVAQCCVQARVVFYGENSTNDCVITKRITSEKGQIITINFEQKEYEIVTQLFGMHNAKNVTAAWLMSFLRTNDALHTAQGIAEFSGTSRRFERRGEYNDALLVDDYAHHPEEILATIRAAREVFVHKKLIVAFHPHTFTRTEALLPEFATALSFADHVIVLDIYSSAREIKGNITAMHVVEAINDIAPSKAQHLPTIIELSEWMQKNLSDKDVFITMGAGDIWKVYDMIQ